MGAGRSFKHLLCRRRLPSLRCRRYATQDAPESSSITPDLRIELAEEELEIPRRIRIELTTLALNDSLTELVRMNRDGISEPEFWMHLQSCNDSMNK